MPSLMPPETSLQEILRLNLEELWHLFNAICIDEPEVKAKWMDKVKNGCNIRFDIRLRFRNMIVEKDKQHIAYIIGYKTPIKMADLDDELDERRAIMIRVIKSFIIDDDIFLGDKEVHR